MGGAIVVGAVFIAITMAVTGMLPHGGLYHCMPPLADMAGANAGIAAVVPDGVAAEITVVAWCTTAAGELPIHHSIEPGHAP